MRTGCGPSGGKRRSSGASARTGRPSIDVLTRFPPRAARRRRPSAGPRSGARSGAARVLARSRAQAAAQLAVAGQALERGGQRGVIARGRSSALAPSSRTSSIWPSRLAAIARPAAMYSNSLVGEPKNGVPSANGTCGEASASQAASIAGIRAGGVEPAGRARSITPARVRMSRTSWRPSPSPMSSRRASGRRPARRTNARARTWTPWNGRKLPTKPMTKSSWPSPSRALVSPAVAEANTSTSTPFGLTRMRRSSTPWAATRSRATFETTTTRAAMCSAASSQRRRWEAKSGGSAARKLPGLLYSRNSGRPVRRARMAPAIEKRAWRW